MLVAVHLFVDLNCFTVAFAGFIIVALFIKLVAFFVEFLDVGMSVVVIA